MAQKLLAFACVLIKFSAGVFQIVVLVGKPQYADGNFDGSAKLLCAILISGKDTKATQNRQKMASIFSGFSICMIP
jgi:hypothetical protein